MQIALIVNPISGVGTANATAGAERIALARRLAASSAVPIDVSTTGRAGHAADLAAEYVSLGYSRIIAWGGDGTINEAAGPLIGTNTTLGIVPSGSGDGFARGLGLPRDPAQAFKLAIETKGRALDVGFLGDRHFLNIAGVGFDAAVAAAFNNRPTRGKGGYLTGTLRGVWGYTTSVYRFESDPHTVEGPCFLLAFANCRQYGSGIVIAPDADPSDGLLDLVVVAGGSPLVQFWRARRLGFRRTAPASGVTRGRITSARLTGEYLLAHVDGQTFEASGTLSVRIVPRGMLVAAP